MISYLDQLQIKSRETGVSLGEACRLEKVAATTPWRWMTGKAAPRQKTVQRLMARMEAMTGEVSQ